ncbi:hypothetical protein GWK47_002886 [Chionoecetes opilio]|uniref:Uncharacterized protein n=1 Tax=Chionoecetes opilio TaxID=41210 RepID=A0A8J4XKH8_CHIOP|nr:hypothetical protein GWK47_002886 [Chionoecetes opilio]
MEDSSPQVSFTPTSKAAPPLLQKQLALEHIAAVSSSSLPLPISTSTAPCSQMGARGALVYSLDVAPPEEAGFGRRLPNLSSSTYCELQGLLLAVFVDSFPCGIAANDKVDLLAKTACSLPLPDGATPSLLCFKHIADADSWLADTTLCLPDFGWDHRPVWQVSEAGDIPHFSSCKLCDRPRANSLQHYCLECPSVRDMLPQGQPLLAVVPTTQEQNFPAVGGRLRRFLLDTRKRRRRCRRVQLRLQKEGSDFGNELGSHHRRN